MRSWTSGSALPASMATTIPGCKGRVLAQGLTYRFSDPSPGEVVAVHAAETDDGKIIPDKDADDRTLVLRVAAGPGDTIVGKGGTVFVNEIKFDDITTKPFPEVKVPNEQYFLLGDNRSAAVDSRTFGPVLGNAIFAKVFAVYWPLRDMWFFDDSDDEIDGVVYKVDSLVLQARRGFRTRSP